MIAAAWRGTDWILLITVIVLLSVSGFFALAETSLVRMSRSKAAALADEGLRGSSALMALASEPDKFLNPLLLLILVCQLVSATLVGVLAEHQFGTYGLIVATVTEVVFIFVIFEAIPKNFAVLHPDSSALFAAPIVTVVLAFWPVRAIAGVLLNLAKWVLKPFGVSDDSHKVTESEIIAMASMAEADESIERHERQYIHSVLEMGDTLVREIMVPRVDMVYVTSQMTVEEALDLAVAQGRSRLPVVGEDVDDIIGVINYRWMLTQIREGHGERKISDIGLKEPRFVPETRKVATMIQQFNQARHHLFIVVDEYGGTAGIVTLEDVLEELVGEIAPEEAEPVPDKDPRKSANDDKDLDKKEATTTPKFPLRISARLNIDDANEQYGLDLDNEGSWDTVGGLVLDGIGGLPKVGDEITSGQYRLRVETIGHHRVDEVTIDLAGDKS